MDDEKERDPTMERSTTEEKETAHKLKLDQLYKSLKQEWDSIKLTSTSRTLRTRSSYTDSSIETVKTLSLLGNSPRTLMSSLQQWRIRSPSDEVTWKVRTNDLAVMEILRERRAAIESGKLKGKRLFEEAEEEEEEEEISPVGFGGREEMCSSWNNGLIIQECEVRSVTSYDSDDHEEGICGSNGDLHVCLGHRCRRGYCCYSSYGSTSSFDDINEILEVREVKEGQKVVAEEDQTKRGVIGASSCSMVMLVCLAVALIVCAVCINSGYRNEYEAILVPT